MIAYSATKLKSFNKDRLPQMLAWKYKFMAENIFRFYRGSAHLFFEELSQNKIPDSPVCWSCGDLHLENFGSYKGDNQQVYFDLNDFDEALLAPSAWDLIRFTTSVFVAFYYLKMSDKKALNMVKLFLKTYAETLAEGKALYIERDTAKGIVRRFLKATAKRSQQDFLDKNALLSKGTGKLNKNNPQHKEVESILKRELCQHITEWILQRNESPYNVEVLDVKFLLEGTGSIGLKRYVFLLHNLLDKKKFLLLEMKQATEPALSNYIKTKQVSWPSTAQRVVQIQKRMQNVSPALLSATVFKEDAYIVQEMQPVMDSIDFKLIKGDYRDIYQVLRDMGILTASAQLRSAGREGSVTADALIAFGKDTSWQDGIVQLAVEQLKVVKSDYQNFMKDYTAGKYKGKKQAE